MTSCSRISAFLASIKRYLCLPLSERGIQRCPSVAHLAVAFSYSSTPNLRASFICCLAFLTVSGAIRFRGPQYVFSASGRSIFWMIVRMLGECYCLPALTSAWVQIIARFPFVLLLPFPRYSDTIECTLSSDTTRLMLATTNNSSQLNRYRCAALTRAKLTSRYPIES